uniref:Uncharacterized protein n=1 Tax=Arundo donax TaxID=35708 RepID=A0A0A9GJS4_ARUDO
MEIYILFFLHMVCMILKLHPKFVVVIMFS